MEKQTTYRCEIIGTPRPGQSVKALDLIPGLIVAFLGKGAKENLEDIRIKSIEATIVFEDDNVEERLAAIKTPAFLTSHLGKNFDLLITKQKAEEQEAEEKGDIPPDFLSRRYYKVEGGERSNEMES